MKADAFVVDPRKARCSRLHRSVREAARLHETEADWSSRSLGRSGFRKTFITLTYRQTRDWQAGHVSDFLRLMRQWFQRRGEVCRFVWVAELQQRGALHYHVLVWVPRRLRLPTPDRCGWWPHGSSKIETARSPIGYMVKYATKTRPEDVVRLPKGARLHGAGGLDAQQRVQRRQVMAPAWLSEADDARRVQGWIAEQEREPEDEGTYYERRAAEEVAAERYLSTWGPKGFPRYVRVPGGYVSCWTGEFVETPWRVSVDQGVVTVSRKENVQWAQ